MNTEETSQWQCAKTIGQVVGFGLTINLKVVAVSNLGWWFFVNAFYAIQTETDQRAFWRVFVG